MGASDKLIVNLTRGNVLCEHTAIIDTPLPRMRGLLGRRSLPRGEGMLLVQAPSIHTAFMRFEFDAVFLDGSLHVIRLVEHLKPWRAVTVRHAVSVLELAAGEISRRGVEIGDLIAVADPEFEIGAGARGDEAEAAGAAEPGVAAGDSGGRQAPARILLVGADRRFRSVAAALLQRRGYAVRVEEQVASVAEIAAQGDIDVVVLDAGALPAVAALEAARIEALTPTVGFVLVSDGLAQTAPATAVVQKWGSFDAIYDAIEVVRAARQPANGPSS
jgi:uncharacterized membrane protein (UPF0127 family)/CheY-like chemotaxis protein